MPSRHSFSSARLLYLHRFSQPWLAFGICSTLLICVELFSTLIFTMNARMAESNFIAELKVEPKPNSSDGREEENLLHSQASSSQPVQQSGSPLQHTLTPKEFILSVARRISAQPLQTEQEVWGVLTAISKNARKRPQGTNILLVGEEHSLGRLVDDQHFQIEGIAVSAKHCKIYKEDNNDTGCSALLKDSSTNGTYHNWKRLRKNSSEAKLNHGDIISFIGPPHHDAALAFVYRDVSRSNFLKSGVTSKRKSEHCDSGGKRYKGLGIGAPEGPIYLDDIRSLQRSNSELREQLDSHVQMIETLRNEYRAFVAHHETEVKTLRESVSDSFLEQIKELQHLLGDKQREVDELSALSAVRQNIVEDLNERLSAAAQSRADADEIINSQKLTMSELEAQLEEERNQRREEREKAVVNLKTAIQKAQLEAQEELKRQSEAALRHEKEQQELISKLQETDKESRALVETLRSKLEDIRESFVMSEQKVRQLDAQLRDEHLVSANYWKKADTMEGEVKRLKKELESEKLAREEAWTKVAALELELSAAIRDISIEKRRYQAARERIILRETQIRAFYSTTEEISALFVKQQEQLKAMQRTLEDEENDNISEDVAIRTINDSLAGERWTGSKPGGEAFMVSVPRHAQSGSCSSSDDGSETEKQEYEFRSQEASHTHDMGKKGFNSYMNGGGTAMDPIETEQVNETEIYAHDNGFVGNSIVMHHSGGETLQLDDETEQQETAEPGQRGKEGDTEAGNCRIVDDTQTDIRTNELLTSEALGSWAASSAPVSRATDVLPNGEDVEPALPYHVDAHTNISQSSLDVTTGKLNRMIGIVTPEMRYQFGDLGESELVSDTETQGGSNSSEDKG